MSHIKEPSIPRLKLMAARILAQLMDAVRQALESDYTFEVLSKRCQCIWNAIGSVSSSTLAKFIKGSPRSMQPISSNSSDVLSKIWAPLSLNSLYADGDLQCIDKANLKIGG